MLRPEPYDRYHSIFPEMFAGQAPTRNDQGKATRSAAANNQDQPQEDA